MSQASWGESGVNSQGNLEADVGNRERILGHPRSSDARHTGDDPWDRRGVRPGPRGGSASMALVFWVEQTRSVVEKATGPPSPACS